MPRSKNGVPPQITKAINRFEQAVREHAFKGMQMPEDHDGIEQEYALSRRLLEETIKRQKGTNT